METAQSSPVPAKGQKPTLADIGWLASYSARGLGELFRARLIFRNFKASDIPLRNRAAGNAGRPMSASGQPVDAATLARIRYVIPRLSDRLPWRSDCLIQAIAAQNWLCSLGVQSEIQIGVEKPEDGEFGAHAWLMSGGEIITGGDIAQYDVILSESRLKGDSGTKD